MVHVAKRNQFPLYFRRTIMNRHSTLFHILHHVVAPCLRQFFRVQWKLIYRTQWGDDANSLRNLLNVEHNRPTIKSLNSGNCDDWDLTALFSLLLHSDSVGKHLRNSTAHTAIDSLRKIRNDVSHVSNNTPMNENAFETRCKKIKRCLKELGYQNVEEEIDDIIQERLLKDVSCGCGTDVSCCTPDAGCHATINPHMKMNYWHLVGIIILIFITVASLIIISNLFSGNGNTLNTQKEKNQTIEPTIKMQRNKRDSDRLNNPNFYFPEELIPKHFEGLEREVAQLAEYIKYGETPFVSLDGNVGVDKTSLALKVGLQLMHDGYDVAYCKFNNGQSLRSTLQTISVSMGMYYTPQNITFLSELDRFQAHVRTLLTKRSILIFDDVDNVLGSFYMSKLLTVLTDIRHLNITLITTYFSPIQGNNTKVPVIRLTHGNNFYFPEDLLPKHFIGREHEIAELNKSIETNECPVVNINGLGKTSLSLKVGLYLKQQGYSVSYCKFEEGQSILSALDAISESMGLPYITRGGELSHKLRNMHLLFQTVVSDKTLLIFDDLHNLLHVDSSSTYQLISYIGSVESVKIILITKHDPSITWKGIPIPSFHLKPIPCDSLIIKLQHDKTDLYQLNHPNFYFPKELIPTNFTGKDQEAAQLLENIKYGETPWVSLDGKVGVGKTSLALKVGLQLMHEDYIVAYCKFSNGQSTFSAFHTISESIGLPYIAQNTPFSLDAHNVQACFETVLTKNTVLIFDDIDNLLTDDEVHTYQLLDVLSNIKHLKMVLITTYFWPISCCDIQVPVVHLTQHEKIYFPKELIPKYFAGREHEIAQLTKSIKSDEGSVVNINGHQGLGKTSLSLKVGLDLMQQGYRVAYCKFEEGQSILSALDTISESMGLPYIKRKGKLSHKHEHFHMLFQAVVSDNTLLIFDDIENLFHVDSHSAYQLISRLGDVDHVKIIFITKYGESHTWKGILIPSFHLKPIPCDSLIIKLQHDKTDLYQLNHPNFYFPKELIPKTFTGKDQEAAQLLENIKYGETPWVSLDGRVGVGKTSLALKVGLQLKHEGYSVAYCKFNNGQSPFSAFDTIFESIGLPYITQNTRLFDVRNLQACFETVLTKSTILIFDDIDNLSKYDKAHTFQLFDALSSIKHLKIVLITTYFWPIRWKNILVPVVHLTQHEKINFPKDIIPKYFAGREHEIAQLAKSIESIGSPIVNVNGHPGLGKTSLSLKVGLDLMQQDYTVAYCKFEEGQSMLSALDTISESMGLPYIKCEGELSEKMFHMKLLLQTAVSDKTLFIFDDIDNLLYVDSQPWDSSDELISYLGNVDHVKIILITNHDHSIKWRGIPIPSLHLNPIPCDSLISQIQHDKTDSDQLNHPNFYFPKELIPTNFTGKDQEAAQLVEYIKNGETPYVSLDGNVGVGKTSLALKVGLQLMHEDYIVAYCKFNERQSLLSAFESIYKSFGLSYIPQGTSFSFELHNLQMCVETVMTKSIILIFDDVDNLLQVDSKDTLQLINVLTSIRHLKIVLITAHFWPIRWNKIHVPVIHLKHRNTLYFPEELIPKHFCGREHEIAQLIKSIQSNEGPLVNVIGHLGFGKTSLSLKVGLDLMQQGYRVAYCKFEEGQQIVSAIDTISESMGLPYINREAELSVKLKYMKLLFQTEVRNKTLLIFDDIDGLFEVDSTSTHQLISALGNIALVEIILITRYDRFIAWRGIPIPSLHLSPLHYISSMQLLHSFQPEMSQAEALKLAEIIPGTPFVLEIIGYQLQEKMITPSDITGPSVKQILEQIKPSEINTYFPLFQHVLRKLTMSGKILFLEFITEHNTDQLNDNIIHHMIELGFIKQVSLPNRKQKMEVHYITKKQIENKFFARDHLTWLKIFKNVFFCPIILFCISLLFPLSKLITNRKTLFCVIHSIRSLSFIYMFIFLSNLVLTLIMKPAFNPLQFILNDNNILVTYTLPVIILFGSILTSYRLAVHSSSSGSSKAWEKTLFFLTHTVVCLLFFSLLYIFNLLHCCRIQSPIDNTIPLDILMAIFSGIICFMFSVTTYEHRRYRIHVQEMKAYFSKLQRCFIQLILLSLLLVVFLQNDRYGRYIHVLLSISIPNLFFILCWLSSIDDKFARIISSRMLIMVYIYSMSYFGSLLTDSGELEFNLILSSSIMGLQFGTLLHYTDGFLYQSFFFILGYIMYIDYWFREQGRIMIFTLTDLHVYLPYSCSISFLVAFYCGTALDFKLVKNHFFPALFLSIAIKVLDINKVTVLLLCLVIVRVCFWFISKIYHNVAKWLTRLT